MKTVIFYFSTTGNSLVMAKKISEQMGAAELISIAGIEDSDITADAEQIGIITPVYGWGLPRIVVEFLGKLKLKKDIYVFAVATCAGTPGKVLVQMKKALLKAGGDLDAGFVVKEGANTLTGDIGLVTFMRRISGKAFKSGSERLPEIIATIRDKKKHEPETSSFGANLIGSAFYKMGSMAVETLKKSDSNFSVNSDCSHCQTCKRICPRENIRIIEGKPVWQHNCEVCYACIQWCPTQAIHTQNDTLRYHNPEVTAKDLLLR